MSCPATKSSPATRPGAKPNPSSPADTTPPTGRQEAIRLGDLLGQFIQTDLTGDRVITLRDLLVFSPANPAHRAALNFDYARLFALDAEGHSIVAALHAGDEATLERLLDREFGHTLSRVPAPDSRYQYGRIALGATGEGRAVAAGGVLVVDSALPAEEQVRVAYFPRDAAQTLVLTAEPRQPTAASSPGPAATWSPTTAPSAPSASAEAGMFG